MNYDDWKTSPPEEKEYDEDAFEDMLEDVLDYLYKKPSDLLEFPEIFNFLKEEFREQVEERLDDKDDEDRAFARGRGYFREE